jgi:hypothetical protein
VPGHHSCTWVRADIDKDCAGCTCAGEHMFSLDSRHGPKPEWNVDLSFTYRASSLQSFLHVTVNQTFHTSSHPSDTSSSSVEPGQFLREDKVVTWKAALSMNQLLLCGHGEEVKVMLVDTEGCPSRASVNFIVYPTGRLEEDGVDGSTGAVGTSAGDFSDEMLSGRSVNMVEARDSVGGVFSIFEEMEEIEGNDVLSEHRLSQLMEDSASGRDTSAPAGTGGVDHGRTYSVGALIVTDDASHLPATDAIRNTTPAATTAAQPPTPTKSMPEDGTCSSTPLPKSQGSPPAGGERKQSNWLAEGTLAVIQGISNKPHYNGLHVMVKVRIKDDDKHNDQYNCKLLHPNEAQAVGVKPTVVVRGLNLRVLDSQDMAHVSQDSRAAARAAVAGKRPKEKEKEREKEVQLRKDHDLSTYLPGERVSSRPSSSTKSSAYAHRVIGVTKVRHLCAIVGWI